MTDSEVQSLILSLRKQLRYHAQKYYVEDAPEISDYDYDLLYEQLRSLLTEDEYKAARASVLNSHYTSPGIKAELRSSWASSCVKLSRFSRRETG